MRRNAQRKLLLQCVMLVVALIQSIHASPATTSGSTASPTDPARAVVDRLMADYIGLYTGPTIDRWRTLFHPSVQIASPDNEGSIRTRTLDEFVTRQKNYFATGRQISERLENVRIDMGHRIARVSADFIFMDEGEEHRGKLGLHLADGEDGWKIVGMLFAYDAQSQSAANTPPTVDETLSRLARGDEKKRYFLMPTGEGNPSIQATGLVLVLPGGDGSATFNQFVQNMAAMGIPEGYLVAQLVAPIWFPEQEIVWPTSSWPVKDMKFTSEEFIDAVIDDVDLEYEIDPKRVFILCWSSSGPATYKYLLTSNRVRGAILAGSTFGSQYLPPLAGAKGKPLYLLHSREDTIVSYQKAESAYVELKAAGAHVLLKTYEGEHGEWGKPKFRPVHDAIFWLESQSAP